MPAPFRPSVPMNAGDINGMIRMLKPVLTDHQRARKILEKYWSGKLALIWTIEDIHKAVNERGIALTKEEAKDLLEHLSKHYNRQYGIKWTDLWDLIEDSGYGRKMSRKEEKSFVDRDVNAIQRSKER